MKKKTAVIYLNGNYVNWDRATLSVHDRGLLYGEGIFETMRSYEGTVFMLDEHLKRLFESMKTAGIPQVLSKSRIKDAVYKTLVLNKLKNAYIRLTVTGGASGTGLFSKSKSRPNIFIIARALAPFGEKVYNTGIKAIICKVRQNETSAVCGIKSLGYLERSLIAKELNLKKAQDAILLNTKGYVAEGLTSNIFLLKNDILITPSVESGILPGITRQVVLELAPKLGLKTSAQKVKVQDMQKAREVFLTNSIREIIPVVSIDSKPVGDGKPGEITRAIHQMYRDAVSKYSKNRRR
ncbi:MAG: aminotransferase class IV [bacterium]